MKQLNYAVVCYLAGRTMAQSKAPFDANFRCEAAMNLSHWTRGLYKQVFTTYRDQSIAEGRHSKPRARLSQSAEPRGHQRFKMFDPFISCPPGTTLHRYGGSGDGGKWLCTFVASNTPCLIFSLGSRGDFSFEKAMLEATKCEVHTFDCTFSGTSLEPRHHYHKLCIGRSKDTDFVTLDEAVAMVGASTLDLLKMDIEGFEFDVFADWDKDTKLLPKQLSFELHYKNLYYGSRDYLNMASYHRLVWPGIDEVTLSQLALLFVHLADLGYGVVSQEPNPMCATCSEFTMLVVDKDVGKCQSNTR